MKVEFEVPVNGVSSTVLTSMIMEDNAKKERYENDVLISKRHRHAREKKSECSYQESNLRLTDY